MLDSLLSPWGGQATLFQGEWCSSRCQRVMGLANDTTRLDWKANRQRFLHVPRLPAPWTESPLWQNRNIIQQSSYIKWHLVANISKFRINGALYSLIIHWHLSSWNAGSLDKWTRRFWNASPRCGRSPVARGAPDLKTGKNIDIENTNFKCCDMESWHAVWHIHTLDFVTFDVFFWCYMYSIVFPFCSETFEVWNFKIKFYRCWGTSQVDSSLDVALFGKASTTLCSQKYSRMNVLSCQTYYGGLLHY